MTAGGGFALGLLLGAGLGAVVGGIVVAANEEGREGQDERLLAQANAMWRGNSRTRGMDTDQKLNVIHGYLGGRLFTKWQRAMVRGQY
jgi:hypothetical protein